MTDKTVLYALIDELYESRQTVLARDREITRLTHALDAARETEAALRKTVVTTKPENPDCTDRDQFDWQLGDCPTAGPGEPYCRSCSEYYP